MGHGIWPEEYYLHVTESGTKFTETVKIDEEKDLEYFHVPAHNQVTEAADYLYDFKTVSNYSDQLTGFDYGEGRTELNNMNKRQ